MAPQTGANGVLPVAVLQKNAPASAPRGPKAAQPRLKLVCRRLPPGLTKKEFETTLGEDWKLGAGKVDWMNYRKGKISQDQAKPSKPSRAYLHVTQQTYVTMLGDRVREVTFHDAAKSFQDNALIGPPVLEFSPYPKMPGGRRRNDARQGTIDQDQEFKDFLESLTNPITKPAAPEGDTQKEEKVKTTPLIEALREKKANKDKPQGKGKQARGDAKDDTSEKKILKSGKDAALTSADKNRRLSKAEKAAKDAAVKALNKDSSSSKEASAAAASTEKGTQPPAPERKRGNINIAKSMLQRDLGVAPAGNRRRGTKREIATAQDPAVQQEEATSGKHKAKEAPTPASTTPAIAADKATPASPKKERPSRAERRAYKASLTDKTNTKMSTEDSKAQNKATAPAPTILKKPQTPHTPTGPKGAAGTRAPPTEPAAARHSPAPTLATLAKADATPPARPANPTPLTAASAPPAPAPTSKQAFLKHANPSQGITEPLIEEALKIFGAIEKVEIDKRKGFAYVDFAEPEGLQKAIAAGSVKVAQGAVQVLERKEKVARNPRFNGPPTGPARGRGGFGPRGRGRGGARGGHVAPSAGVGDTAPVTTPVATAGDVTT